MLPSPISPFISLLLSSLNHCHLNEQRNGFIYQSVKDSVVFSLQIINYELVNILMEVGRAVCLTDEQFSKSYITESQESMLRGFQVLKGIHNTPPPKQREDVSF